MANAIRSLDRPSQVHIRRAEPEDLSDLLALLALKAEFDGCPEALTATSAQLQADLFGAEPLAAVLLVECDRDLIGFASYHRIYSTFLAKPGLWLDDLFIKREFRGQSIGRALMIQLCQIAQEQGCARIDWTVAVSNASGIRFYEQIGATVRQDVRTCRLNRAAIDHLAQQS